MNLYSIFEKNKKFLYTNYYKAFIFYSNNDDNSRNNYYVYI